MKAAKIIYAAVATWGLCTAPLAFGSDVSRTVSVVTDRGGPRTIIVEDKSMPNRDVTARAGKYPVDTPVAVVGKVLSRDDGSLILSRRDGQVRAFIPDLDRVSADGAYNRVKVGDSVVIYGRLQRVPGDLTQVDVEAVYDQAADKVYLTTLGKDRAAQTPGTGPVALHYEIL